MSELFTIRKIKSILPYRSPMLMLDRAEKIDDCHWSGLKCVTINEPFFCGHFPNHPIMPGVLQVEAMKQLCELAVRLSLDPEGKRDVYIAELSRVKFRRPNLPGDRAKISVEILTVENGRAVCSGKIENRDGVAAQAELTLGVRDWSVPQSMLDQFTEFDRTEAVAMDIKKLMSLMPHRYPFLLMDYISKIEDNHVWAVKNVSGNEPFFAGLPEDAAVPESLLCEILAQSGCASVLSRPENAGKIGYYMTIESGKSFFPVLPGDQIVVDFELPPARSKFGKGSGRILVEGKTAFEITLMFAIVEP